MLEFASQSGISAARVAACAAIVVVGGAVGGYAVHEHSAAEALAAQNEHITAALIADRNAISDLSAKVNALASRNEALAAGNATTPALHSTVELQTRWPLTMTTEASTLSTFELVRTSTPTSRKCNISASPLSGVSS